MQGRAGMLGLRAGPAVGADARMAEDMIRALLMQTHCAGRQGRTAGLSESLRSGPAESSLPGLSRTQV